MSSKKRIYDFGPFRLDPVKRRLLRNDEQVALTPKAFDTLLALVEVSGQVIEKGELMQRIWPDSFVEEGNLTVNISTLRKALGESPDQHHYIVTVPGKGYRFVADVHELWDEEAELIVEEHTRERVVITGSLIRRLYLHWKAVAVYAALLAAVAVGTIWWLGFKPSTPTRGVSLSALQMKQLASWKIEPGASAPAPTARFSRDGKMLAFSSTKSGRSNIWIKQVMGGDQIQITRGDGNDRTPIWQPDGEQIAFISNRGGQEGIWVSLSHGSTATLLKTLNGESKSLRYWSKDGKTIYYELDHNLYALDIGSKLASQLTNFDASKSLTRDFSVSPDEKSIAYVDSKDGQFDIWTMPVGGGAPRQITNDAYSDLYPTWHPDGARIIYSSSRGTAYQICVAYLDGREPEQITSTTSDCVAPDVLPDGTKILFTTIREESDLGGVKIDGGEEFEITAEVGLETWPEASTDGKSILFQTANGSERLIDSVIRSVSIASGGQQIQFAATGFDPHWSPDGSKVAFLRASGAVFNLWAINAAGGEASQLTTNGVRPRSFKLIPLNRGQDGGYSWSPDSSKLAYCAPTADQRNIWTVSADGSVQSKISNIADANLLFTRPFWSRDGARIASVLEPRSLSPDGHDSWSVWISDLGTVFQYPSYLWLLGWSVSNNGLIVASTEDKDGYKLTDVDLFQISFEGNSRAVAQLKLAYPDSIELSSDGQSVAFVSHQDGWDNVWVVSASGGSATKLTTNTDPRLYLSALTWSPDGKAIYYGKQTRSSEVSMIENFK